MTEWQEKQNKPKTKNDTTFKHIQFKRPAQRASAAQDGPHGEMTPQLVLGLQLRRPPGKPPSHVSLLSLLPKPVGPVLHDSAATGGGQEMAPQQPGPVSGETRLA